MAGSDLTATHDAVAEAARRGVPAVFAPFGARDMPAYGDEAAWSGSTIDAAWLARFLADPDAAVHHAGLTLIGARIDGELDLEAAELRRRLTLRRCQLGAHALDLTEARTQSVRLIDVRCGAVRAARLHAAGYLVLRGCRVEGEVSLIGATVDADIDCTGTRVGRPGGRALVADRAHVRGNVFLHDGFVARGQVRLIGTAIGGALDCTGARLANPGGPALAADRAAIGGNVHLMDGYRAEGTTRLLGTTIGGDLDCTGARLVDPGGTALAADGAHVAGSAFLRDGFRATGVVRLPGAAVGGLLDCSGARFAGAPGDDDVALEASGIQVGGNVRLCRGLHATGQVRLRNATIGGDVDCRGGRFANPAGVALTANRARVTGSVFLTRGLTAEGRIRLRSAVIGGDLDCQGGRFVNRHPHGGDAARSDDDAIDGRRAQITGSVLLGRGFSAEGAVRLHSAAVGGDLDCRDGRFAAATGPAGMALSVNRAAIAGFLYLAAGFRANGLVSLRGATAGALSDDRASWPTLMDIDGFRYDRLYSADARGWRARADWLRRQRAPSPQGYTQLAAVYRIAGDEDDSRRILIERHNSLLRPPERWQPHLPTGPREVARRAWRWGLRLTIGHGFRPARALLIAVPLMLALALWLASARNTDMLVPTEETPATSTAAAGRTPRASSCDDRYPCMQPVVYALDNMVPIVDLGQRSRWTADQSARGATWLDDGRWLAAAIWVTSMVGWVLATLVAASFTQVVRRE